MPTWRPCPSRRTPRLTHLTPWAWPTSSTCPRASSQGQRRRVALARLWLSRSVALWVLDEPFTALDVRGVARLADLVGEHVRSGGIVMLVTHQEVPVDGVEYLVIEPERWSPRRRTAVEAALDNESALEADNAR